jgi:chromosome segregation ATPase
VNDTYNAMPSPSVQRAHDALLAQMPDGAAHDYCPLCASGHDAEQEVASVADSTPSAPAGNVYTEAQHFSLLKSAVEQETSALTTEKSELASSVETLESEKAALATELSDLKTRIDVLESDKATAEAAAETAKKSFEDFKADLQRKSDVEAKKSDRKDRVKAANEHLSDGYFTDERITRWAEMSDDAFSGLVAEMTEFAAAAAVASDKDKTSEHDETKTSEKAADSKAFTGGETASENQTDATPLRGLLMATRRIA